MKREQYRATINAPKEKVWETLWSEETYPKWTAVFSEGSRAETDWKQGSKVRFLNGEGEGMVSRIVHNVPNELMSIEHLGIVQRNGNEILEGEKVRPWAGAMENYQLQMTAGKTELKVEMDVADEYEDYFQKTWPKALKKLRQLAENEVSTNI